MATSVFARAAQAAHRATLRIMGNADDARGRPLLLFWPESVLSDRREVQVTYHKPPIRAYSGQARRAATSAAGLTEIPEDTITFVAELGHFPEATPPGIGMCFMAGPNRDEAVLYRVLRAPSNAGIVEIEAQREP